MCDLYSWAWLNRVWGRESERSVEERGAHENISLLVLEELKNLKTSFFCYPKVLSWWPSLLSGQKSVLRTWWNWHLEKPTDKILLPLTHETETIKVPI